MNFEQMQKALLKKLKEETIEKENKIIEKKIQLLKRKAERHKELFNNDNTYSVKKENERLKSNFNDWNSSGWKSNGSYKQPIKHKLF